jgi:hypothetical protein
LKCLFSFFSPLFNVIVKRFSWAKRLKPFHYEGNKGQAVNVSFVERRDKGTGKPVPYILNMI